MSDFVNRFFDSVGGSLGRAFGNPETQQLPDYASGGINRTGFGDSILHWPLFGNNGNLVQTPLIASREYTGHSGKTYQLEEKKGMGFTPLEYYKVYNTQNEPEYRVVNQFEKVNTFDRWEKIEEQYSKYNNDPTLLFKKHGGFIDDEYNVSTLMRPNDLVLDPTILGNRLDYYSQGEYLTPKDNEDPIYFGFKVIIDVDNSPLLNGTVDQFIEKIGQNYSEVRNRLPILKEFRKELSRYFEFSRELDSNLLQGDVIFDTSDIKRYYYLVKIAGLDKLNESNVPSKNSPFVNYQTDLLTFTMREDVSTNLGTLYSLYKSLYWSRLNGKSLIPENLLRFDCKIIISEVRNLVTIRKSISNPLDSLNVSSSSNYSKNILDSLRSNLSRYVYDIYECQLFFDKPPHEASIDLSVAPKEYPTHDISISYKYSNMTYERFNFESDEYKKITQAVDPTTLPDWISYKDKYISNNLGQIKSEMDPTIPSNDIIQELKNNAKEISMPPQPSFGQILLSELRSFGLNTAQSLINSRFALLNQTLDNLRNQFGVGRMTPPTNIYFGNTNVPGLLGRFFDVRNSLLNFGGSSLVDLLGVGSPGQTSNSSGEDFTTLRFPGYSPAGQTGESELIDSDTLDLNFPGYSPAGQTGEPVHSRLVGNRVIADPQIMNLQFPNWAQRFPAPVNLGPPLTPTMRQNIIETMTNAQYATTDINKVGFPTSAQKFPPPIY
jgi:hypothetical protein